MSEASAVLSSITPLPIDPVQLYASLVDFSNYEPVTLQPKPNTRSAAVTILIRFTRNGQVVDLNFLHGAKGITFDEDLVKAGTLRYERVGRNFAHVLLFFCLILPGNHLQCLA